MIHEKIAHRAYQFGARTVARSRNPELEGPSALSAPLSSTLVARDKGEEFLRTWKILPVSSLPRDLKTIRVLAKPLQLCTTQALGASMWKYPPASEKSNPDPMGVSMSVHTAKATLLEEGGDWPRCCAAAQRQFGICDGCLRSNLGQRETKHAKRYPRCGEKILIRGTLLSLTPATFDRRCLKFRNPPPQQP
jgi:hypothetical protein